MSYYGGGCPSWVARMQGAREGRSYGYSEARTEYESKIKEYEERLEKLTMLAIKPEIRKVFEDEIRAQLKLRMETEFKKEKAELLNGEYIELKRSITNEITKKVYAKLRKELEDYKLRLNPNQLVLFPNLKIMIDYLDYSKIECRIEEVVGKKFEKLGYEIEYTMAGKERGHPDFICRKGIEELYIEVKSHNDALRISQAEWILNNKEKNVIICYIDFAKEEKQGSEI